MNYSIKITDKDYNHIKGHLFPDDGKEAVAIALCGRIFNENDCGFLVHKVLLIPYEKCSVRESTIVTWSTSLLTPMLNEALKKGLAIVKFHSHPNGFSSFSKTDNESDKTLFNSIFGWIDDEKPHASIVMLPSGKLFGRAILPDLNFVTMSKFSIVGDDIVIYNSKLIDNLEIKEYQKRTKQTFGEGTTNLLQSMKAAVIGCSGTGSPTIEQLVRLGIGKIILVDPDKVEEKNLNRILNTKMTDAKENRYKVDVMKDAIQQMGLNTDVEVYKNNMFENTATIKAISSCDIIFGCVDSVDGRHLLNHISSFYLIPYLDIGVKIVADGNGGIDQICGNIHFIKPGGSSLQSRGLYTGEELRAAGILRSNPNYYMELKRSGYIVNINVESPAVISINMFASSIAVNEFLARIHRYRYDKNSETSIIRFSISDFYIQKEGDGETDTYLLKYLGRGDMNPLLNMPELS